MDVLTPRATMDDIEEALAEIGVESRPGFTPPAAKIPRLTQPQEGGEVEAQKAIQEYGQVAPIPEPVNIFTRSVKNLMNGVKLGVVGEIETVDYLAKFLSKATGLPHTDALERVSNWMRPTEAEIAAGGSTLYDKVVRSVGHAIPLIAQLVAGGGVVRGALQVAKLPAAIKLGKTAITGGKRFVTEAGIQQAKGLAKVAGKKVRGIVPLHEPLAFGAYEATHAALEPGATPGKVAARTLEGLLMGTALPLARELPQVFRQAAPAALAGGFTVAGGGTGEEALTSAITMATLASWPEVAKAGGKLLGKKMPTAPEGPKILDVSEEAKAASGGILNGALNQAGYEPKSYQNWSPYQKQMVLFHTLRNAEGKPTGKLPLKFNDTTGMLSIDIEDYKIDIPRENPKAVKKSTTPLAASPELSEQYKNQLVSGVDSLYKGLIKSRTLDELRETRELESLSEKELTQIATFGEGDTKLEAMMEIERRSNTADKIHRTELFTGKDGVWTGAVKYIEDALKGRKVLTEKDLGDIIEKQLLPPGWESVSNRVDELIGYLRQKGYEIVPSKTTEATEVDIESAFREAQEAQMEVVTPPTTEPFLPPESPKPVKKGKGKKAKPPELPSGFEMMIEKGRKGFLGPGGPPPIKETIKQKQERMRKWSEEFEARQLEEAKVGGPEIATTEGARALQREAIGGVIGVSGRGGVITTRRGGLRGRLFKEEGAEFLQPGGAPFEPVEPTKPRKATSSDDAFRYGQELRAGRRQNAIDVIWNEYLDALKKIQGVDAPTRKTKTFRQQVIDNSLRKEIVESYLGMPKTTSLTIEDINTRLGELQPPTPKAPTPELMGKATTLTIPTISPNATLPELFTSVGRDLTKEMLAYEKSHPASKPEEVDAALRQDVLKDIERRKGARTQPKGERKGGDIITLPKLSSPLTEPTIDFERRAQLLVEASKIEPKWHMGALREFSDEALENIVKYKLTPEADVTWVPTAAKQAAIKRGRAEEQVDYILARIPAGERVSVRAGDIDAIKSRLKRSGYENGLIESVDWEKVTELQKQGPLEIEDIETKQAGKPRKVSYGELPEKGIEDMSDMDKLAVATGWSGVEPELFVGPMIAGMSFRTAMRKIQTGRLIPGAPEGVYKGYKPAPHKLAGVGDDTLAAWFEGQLKKATGEDTLREDYGETTERRLIREALPGLRSEMLGDPESAAAANKLNSVILEHFIKGRKTKPFSEAAQEAFVKGWRGFVKYQKDPAFKAQLERNILDILEETPTDGEGIESMPTGDGFLGPGGVPYKPDPRSPTKKLEDAVEASRQFKMPGVKAPLPQTEADVLVNDANKMTDTFRNYKDVLDLAARNGKEQQEIVGELWKTLADRESMAGASPEALAPLDEKINRLKERRLQLMVDNEYLFGLKDWFARTGKPFTGKEVYLEEELTRDEYGLDGTIISKAAPKGATFYIVQNLAGGGSQPGQPGHNIYAKAEVRSRQTKGDVVSWEMPEGMDPRAEDALYNSILERFMWRTQPIEIKNVKGIAEKVAARRIDTKYATSQRSPDYDIMKLLPEDSAIYKELKQKMHDTLIAAATATEGKEYGKYTKEKREEFLRRAQSLTDAQIGYDLENLYTDPSKIGISDPEFNYKRLEYMPLIDRIGDPTQSRVVPVAYVGNLAQQAQLSIANYMDQYFRMAEDYLGKYKNDAISKQKIMRHLIASGDSKVKSKHPDWITQDPELLEGARGYRLIMEDMAQLFNLREKGLYRENYATINYDTGKIWESYAKKFAAAESPSKLPDSILSKIDPADFKDLHDYAASGKNWDQLGDDARAFIVDKFFKYNTAYESWEMLPEIVRARIPKQKFIKYFQHRTTEDIMDFALNEDVWDVLMHYISSVVHDGVMSDFFLPKARRVTRSLPALGVGETTSVRGYLDSYIKQVAGFDKNTPATKFLDSLAKTINGWFGKPLLPEAGVATEAANLYQQWLYRGALGVDTAVRNLTQSIYTIAEMGGYNWLKGLKGYIEHGWKKDQPWKTFANQRKLVEEFFDLKLNMFKQSDPNIYERWKDLDRRVTSLALHPMRITEHINRGIAYFAGLSEAAEQGISFEAGHAVGLKRATTYAHPLEMSEAEWHATQKMYGTQFGYGRIHTSPLMTGTLSRFFTPFWSFPVKSLQFISNLGKESLGIERWGEAAKKEPWLTSEKAKLTRFLALTGFMVTAPKILAETLGIDAGYMWGKGLFPNNFAPMWMGMIEDFYTGIMGGPGMSVPASEKDKDAARKRLLNSVYMLAIPQWRFMKKTKNVAENLERGYYGMGPNELAAQDTTYAKEIVNLLGFPPYTKEAKQLVWDAYRQRGDMLFIKQDALKEAATAYREGDWSSAAGSLNKAMSKYPELKINEQDIRDYIRHQETTTAYEEAEKHISKEMKPEWQGKLMGAQKKFVPKGPGKTRSFWVNTAPLAMPEESPESILSLMSMIGEGE